MRRVCRAARRQPRSQRAPSPPDCIACALSCSCCFSSARGKVAYLKSLKRTFQLKQNSTLISSQVTNWTFSDRLRAITDQIQVPRNVDQRAAAELLRQAASETSGVVKNPAPQAYITALSSNTLILELRAWTDRYEDWMKIQSDLGRRLIANSNTRISYWLSSPLIRSSLRAKRPRDCCTEKGIFWMKRCHRRFPKSESTSLQ